MLWPSGNRRARIGCDALEGERVTLDAVPDGDGTAELLRVRGELQRCGVDDRVVAVVDLFAVLVVGTESSVRGEEVGVFDLARPVARPGVVDIAPALEVPTADEPLRCHVLQSRVRERSTNASHEFTRRHSPTSGLVAGLLAREDGVFVASFEGSSLDPHPPTASTAPASIVRFTTRPRTLRLPANACGTRRDTSPKARASPRHDDSRPQRAAEPQCQAGSTRKHRVPESREARLPRAAPSTRQCKLNPVSRVRAPPLPADVRTIKRDAPPAAAATTLRRAVALEVGFAMIVLGVTSRSWPPSPQ
jgi:hypothetical protein